MAETQQQKATETSKEYEYVNVYRNRQAREQGVIQTRIQRVRGLQNTFYNEKHYRIQRDEREVYLIADEPTKSPVEATW